MLRRISRILDTPAGTAPELTLARAGLIDPCRDDWLVEAPVAWIVGRLNRNGELQLCLPLLRSAEEMERYARNNPDENLVPLFASPPKTYEDGPKVKALEWEERTSPREDGPAETTGDWTGIGILGAGYGVYIFEDHYEVTREDGEFVESHLGDLDEAKAAAQADYEKRILSALIGAPK